MVVGLRVGRSQEIVIQNGSLYRELANHVDLEGNVSMFTVVYNVYFEEGREHVVKSFSFLLSSSAVSNFTNATALELSVILRY